MTTIRRLTGYLRPYWRIALVAPLLMVIEVVMDLIQPRFIERIVDVGIAQLDTSVIVSTGLLMVGASLIGAIGGIGNTFFAVRASQSMGADLRADLFRKVHSLSFGNLDRLKTGQLITRLTNDVTQVAQVVLTALRILVRAPLLLVGSLIMAFVTSPKLSLLFLVLSPIVLGVAYWLIRRAGPMFMGVQRRMDRVNTVMQENLSGIRLVKAFVRSKYETKRFGQANEDLTQQTIRAVRMMAVAMPLMMLTVNLGTVAVLWFGGIDVAGGAMTVGTIIAFTNYLTRVLREMLMVSMLLTHVARAGASATRIVEVLDSEPEVQDRPGALTECTPQGRVAFENVSFGYDGDEATPVLREVSFVAEPGQTVAILGETGSGKSSLVHLIPRFYDVTEGRITIDGVDVRDVTQSALRGSVGIALQESILFSGTIRDNIRYGRPEATDEEIIAAARAAQAHEFITQFPDGYDTVLGQRGVNLSGGQKQRVAIARALCTNPAILILDDSTSSVDVDTEARIQEALARTMADCTSIVIAQRVSTVLNADKILVLDGGTIAAEGTHEELMETSPIYREIYDSQLGNGVRIND